MAFPLFGMSAIGRFHCISHVLFVKNCFFPIRLQQQHLEINNQVRLNKTKFTQSFTLREKTLEFSKKISYLSIFDWNFGVKRLIFEITTRKFV